MVSPMDQFPDAPDMRSKSASAYEHLKRLAIGGDLRPGRRLSPNDLAYQFQVSITPVRDALVRLAAEGFVRVQANRGYFTKSWSVDEQRDLLGVLAIHYLAALERRGSGLAHARLEALALEEDGDPGRASRSFVERLEGFYGDLVASTGNAVAGAVVRNALDRTRHIRRIDFEDPAARAGTRAALEAVVAAISEGDLIAAIAQSRAHFERMLPRLPRAVARANEEGQKLRFP